MTDHAANRDAIVSDLARELFGPAPAGPEIDPLVALVVPSLADSYGPWRQRGSGEEILLRDTPVKRYGVGVLFPLKIPQEDFLAATPEREQSGDADVEQGGAAEQSAPEGEASPLGGAAESETDDLDLSLANAYQPSALGLSFLAELSKASKLTVKVSGSRYRRHTLRISIPDAAEIKDREKERACWLRTPVSLVAEFAAEDLLKDGTRRVVARGNSRAGDVLLNAQNAEGLSLQIEVFSRPQNIERQRLLTVCIVNRTSPSSSPSLSELCLFQTHCVVSVSCDRAVSAILPYPTSRRPNDDTEMANLELLYRAMPTFATGHGCSANWSATTESGRAEWVSIECLPVVEVPNITPEITREDGTSITVPMARLAGVISGDDGLALAEEVVGLYERWIGVQRGRVPGLPDPLQAAAAENLTACERAAGRMRDGLAYVAENPIAKQAFQLANHAILLQQIATRETARTIDYDAQAARLVFSEDYIPPDARNPPPGRGSWRGFQIAFLLASIRSTVEEQVADRRTVELIWFPTGGGKTEAYLALSAFAMFMRRLRHPDDIGVHVLMRYTLRLLTTQQFQRASGLLCAMEYLRRSNRAALGSAPFSLGIWVGGETTPNTRDAALQDLRDIERYPKARNRFLLSRCPWCGAQFRRLEVREKGQRSKSKAIVLTPGLARQPVPGANAQTVTFKCPDKRCEFTDGLPVQVIDEDIYTSPPSLLIGTIDKFAVLAWKPEAASLFGLDGGGSRVHSPPGLIIQDELHLISGPLGSLAGLYETAIEELCTDRRGDEPIPPKIISSTATIRRYVDQIGALYARSDTALFPPPGLDAGDSFFARYDLGRRGRIYVGVHAASLGSVQTEWVRTFTSLIQSPMSLPEEARDPWWTTLVFFNSIREMGTAHTLFQSDVPDYAKVIWSRLGTAPTERRYLSASRMLELTGGLPSDEIAGAITALEGPYGRPYALDVCLASNIIEVGIDIQRLSLMVVAGQPKTTSQYIQVTGRVGRRSDRPGLVITMYSPSKPRDRSHFERFRSYHQQLYAQVEPTSVTPFAPPALDRALHAVMVIFARLTGGATVARSPYPFPDNVIETVRQALLRRVQAVDPAEASNLARVIARRMKEWRDWRRTRWQKGGTEEIAQLRPAGDYATDEEQRLSWATPTSMRNVDAECEAAITTLYIETGGGDAPAAS